MIKLIYRFLTIDLWRKLFLSVFCLGIFIPGRGQTSLPPPYQITSDTSAYAELPASNWQVMTDPDGKLTLQQVLNSNHFQDTDRKVHYQYHVYWVRYRLVNNMPREAEIALPVATTYADLYTKLDHGKWQHARTGLLVRWNRRDGLKRIPAFTITIPPGKELTVYKRMHWNYIARQPDSIKAGFGSAKKLIQQNYIRDESYFMTSIQDAFLLGLVILSMIISFYFFLVVHEKEFLFFSLSTLFFGFQALSSLNDVFLREYPRLLLYLYIFGNSLATFMLIHGLRLFLKTFKRFPLWDKWLFVFSFLQVIGLLFTYFSSALFRVNLAASSHLLFNLIMLLSCISLLVTLFLYIRERDIAVRLMIIAFTPILLLQGIAYYSLAVVFRQYYPRFGAPSIEGYALPFNKAAFLVLIVSYLWMMVFFTWVLFLRFYNIRKEYKQQTELDHLKSRFFANISHEFRTPLTLIMGPLEDLIHTGDAEKFKHIVPEMYHNSKRLLQLINQLLDLSKLDAGSYRVNTSREDIIPFIKQIVHSFSSMAHRKNIELELNVDEQLETLFTEGTLHFFFDDDVIEKIVNNLLSNAFKFTPEGGKITVYLNLPKNKKDFLEIKVEDTGVGIPAEKLPYIFDRFYQVDDSAKRQYEGSGIGLALLKELVDLHQGAISVSSQINKGTIFYCHLPLNKRVILGPNPATVRQKEDKLTEIASEEATITEIDEVADPQDRAVVLIVEDQQDVRKYIREKLLDHYTVLEAENGKEGWETAIKEIPDLVISDVMMPKMSGSELCKVLKTDDRTSHIPVILLTARAADSDKISGLETGADAYLIKPFNSQELLIRVNNLILIRNKMRVKFGKMLVVKPSEITVTSRDQTFMQNLLSIVENHIGDAQFSVEQLGSEMNMSTSQLNRKLRAIIDQSVQQFIRSVRMQRALELLKNNAGTISDVAWQVGFEDPGYFTKVFKNHFGCLPSEKEKFTR